MEGAEALEASKAEVERDMVVQVEKKEVVEQQRKEVMEVHVEKEEVVVEQCFICDAPATSKCSACSQVPICKNHQEYHQAGTTLSKIHYFEFLVSMFCLFLKSPIQRLLAVGVQYIFILY